LLSEARWRVKVALFAFKPEPVELSATLPLKFAGTFAAVKALPAAGVVTEAVIGAVASQPTDALFEAATFPKPAVSWAALALTCAVTVPGVVMPATATLYVSPVPVTVGVFVPPAVPPSVKPVALKPVTDLLKTTVKLIGDVLVGSACATALLIVTVGGLSTVRVKF
jgi:hypothetical protein